ncbi:MAG: hypothetical protein ACTSUE_21225 [Promethearchaeota archaeon]
MDFNFLGWQVGVTYGSRRPGGVDKNYMLQLLDEMERHGMNLLSLMMISYGFFDPEHDGYPWPVKNPRLKPYQDNSATNGADESEFMREIIGIAGDKGIEVELFMNWGIWNHQKITAGYPGATGQMEKNGKADEWLHCPDSPAAWQAGLDEVLDLLDFYKQRNVKRYSFERISYKGRDFCYCNWTKKKFREDTGKDIATASRKEILSWKSSNISRKVSDYVKVIKSKFNLKVGLHTQGNRYWGHDPRWFQAAGVDFLEPHTIQFKTSQKGLHRMLHHLSPNSCILHFCARDIAPAHYPIWIKTPKIIKKAASWIKNYPGENVDGIMFFNEPSVSGVNKEAIYRVFTSLPPENHVL